MKDKIKTSSFWLGVGGAIVLIINCLSDLFGFAICTDQVESVIVAICSVVVKILMNMLLEMNDFDWFATLTFDKDKIDRTDDEIVFNAYKKYINNIKKQFPSLGYMCFPERHEDDCIHFHMLLNGIRPKELGLVNSGKVCCSWATFKNKVSSYEYFERIIPDIICTKVPKNHGVFGVTSSMTRSVQKKESHRTMSCETLFFGPEGSRTSCHSL